jgi:hypothetical protein
MVQGHCCLLDRRSLGVMWCRTRWMGGVTVVHCTGWRATVQGIAPVGWEGCYGRHHNQGVTPVGWKGAMVGGRHTYLMGGGAVHACIGIEYHTCWMGGRPQLAIGDWALGPFDRDGMLCCVVSLETRRIFQRANLSFIHTTAMCLPTLFLFMCFF